MKSNLVVPVVFLVVFVACAIFGDVVESGWSFLAGAIFALSVRDVGKELIDRATRR